MAAAPVKIMATQPRYENIPAPDPSTLTTEALRREITMLHELLLTSLTAHQEITLERFRGIEVQFNERDKRTDQTARDSKVAVDAAFSAAKEAVAEQNKSSALAIAKSEAGTTKQIDQMQALIGAVSKALEDKINDVKERVARGDGRDVGSTSTLGYLMGVGSLVLAAASVILLYLRSPS